MKILHSQKDLSKIDLIKQKLSGSLKFYWNIGEVIDILNDYGSQYYSEFYKKEIPKKHNFINHHNINYDNLKNFFVITTDGLRFWEEHFEIEPKKRNRIGYRRYNINEIIILLQLYHWLKIEGMNITILKIKIIMDEIQLKKT